MRLSRQELRVLDEIAHRLRSDDPALAATLTASSAGTGRQMWLAWPGLWIGWVVTIAGLGAARGLISGGVIVGFYGFGLVVVATVTLVRDLVHRRRDGSRTGGVGRPSFGRGS